MKLVVVDYQMGNLGSIRNMLKKVGHDCEISCDAAVIQNAGKLILPGVGSFDAGISNLRRLGLEPVLTQKVLGERVPVLGICLGMQLMTNGSEEGRERGLGWIDAEVLRFDNSAEPRKKIPHMGWNVVHQAKESPLLDRLRDEPRFYFVHSYFVRCKRRDDVLLYADYIDRFDAAFEWSNVIGVQFHPEKSHRFGMTLLENFAAT